MVVPDSLHGLTHFSVLHVPIDAVFIPIAHACSYLDDWDVVLEWERWCSSSSSSSGPRHYK
jgi:hypothetical protein